MEQVRIVSGTTLVDVMDPERVVVISEKQIPEATFYNARIYWNKNVGGKIVRVFGGSCQIPRNLILSGNESSPSRWGRGSDNRFSQPSRVGYMPEAAFLASQERAKRAERPKHREEEDDDTEWND